MRSSTQPGPTGRPRLSGVRPSDGAAVDEIVAVATRLFMEKGYAQTTMRDIANSVGLRQSSLYYYFNRKELILKASFSLNRAPLTFIEQLEGGSPGLRLYRFSRFDTCQLCQSPWDVNEVERLADLHRDLFEELWRDRQGLQDRVVELITEGIAARQFEPADPQLTALAVTSFDEGVQNWYRRQVHHQPGGDSPFVYPAYSVRQVSDLVAAAALRLVLRNPEDLTDIKQQAMAFDAVDLPGVP